MTSERVTQGARDFHDRLAGDQLRREEARLYSHHTRLRNRQPGLSSWTSEETADRLSDAVSLVHVGTILREANDQRWRMCFVRCGELLEWLSHPAINIDQVPSELLSAAAYDLAGYPARANALLKEMEDRQQSHILHSFLRGDLKDTLESIRLFWQESVHSTVDSDPETPALPNVVMVEVIRSISVICSFLRWPAESRLPQALSKLRNASALYASDRDQFSWLLAKLVADVSREHTDHGWRTVLAPLAERVSKAGRNALDRYCRLAFSQARSRAWPSQEEGIRRLLSDGSFALCTPTGSGKTSVAEIALLEAIFGGDSSDELTSPLAMYLVPSKALAAEVEGKLTRVLKLTSSRRVVVTGLYGGTDWGPTDAWLTADEPAVVICTYEKAEALLRFIGPLIVPRLTLVIFDEAHAVQFNGQVSELRSAENRSLRLESLGLRISQLIDRSKCRLIALSAVAAGLEDSLQQWVSGLQTGSAAIVKYRSTRQLIGRLIVAPTGSLSIYYDILDGKALRVSGDSETTPYVPNALPRAPRPPSVWTGVEKSLRPATLWAALHFAAPDDHGRRHTVLISVPQGIAGYAKDFLELLERHWTTETPPTAIGSLTADQTAALNETLTVCADSFGTASYEYRLLRRGIAIHHANMPRSLSLKLIELISSQTVSIVLATSTLSEGINIPVETILVPSLLRAGRPFSGAEFRNLAGRAGRPGVATEGRTLVVLPPASQNNSDTANWRYSQVLTAVLQVTEATPRSPLAEAINDLWQEWCQFARSTNFDQFLTWLEQVNIQQLPQSSVADFSSLDSLDSVLIAGIVENEELPSGTEWEERLQSLWNSTFASALATEEQRLAFVHRGAAIPTLYPDRDSRRRLYRTGLPPSTAFELFREFAGIEAVLATGGDYAIWASERRFQFLVDAVKAIGAITRFRMKSAEPEWVGILRWWMWPSSTQFPAANKIAEWHKEIGTSFSYRCCWALGSVIGYAFERISDGEFEATSLDAWQDAGLPWIVFWLKELLAWGTLEPVAAFLLGRGAFLTRREAEQAAQPYYASEIATSRSDPLDARSIRDWCESEFQLDRKEKKRAALIKFPARIVDEAIAQSDEVFRVVPLFTEKNVKWADVAGYVLATSSSQQTSAIRDCNPISNDFVLKPSERVVTVREYV